MPNGAGIMGHHSTMEGSIAFPDPADPDMYYLLFVQAVLKFIQGGWLYLGVHKYVFNTAATLTFEMTLMILIRKNKVC